MSIRILRGEEEDAAAPIGGLVVGHPVFQTLPSAVDVVAMRPIQGAVSSLAQQADGLPGWAIPLVLIAVIVVVLAIFALTRRRID